jgi:hypothetical protein
VPGVVGTTGQTARAVLSLVWGNYETDGDTLRLVPVVVYRPLFCLHAAQVILILYGCFLCGRLGWQLVTMIFGQRYVVMLLPSLPVYRMETGTY